jgi:hypothetical protein
LPKVLPQAKKLSNKVETTNAPVVIQLTPDRTSIKADGQDVSK